MLKELWILSLYHVAEHVDCFDENREKIMHLSGDWKDKKEAIFKQLTKDTIIHDCRKEGTLALELSRWLMETCQYCRQI
jgi:hypothetical protein